MTARHGERRGSLGTRAPVIGLIGPIGCGKSTVAGWLAERGVAIIDSDQLTRRLMTPGSPVTGEILARFGPEYLLEDGELDRRALGRLVFSDPARLTELAILITARKWKAQFEWFAHLPLALKAGLDPRVADAVARGERPAVMAPEETLVFEFCSELLATGQVSDGCFAAARDAFGERGVIDLVGTLGYYGLISMVLNVDRCPLPGGAPPPLA